MIAPIDVTKLPPAAQKILDPKGPPPLKAMAAKAVVPGMKPADLIVVVVLLAEAEGTAAEIAKQTLAKLPAPVLNGALAADLEPLAIDRLARHYMDQVAVMERLLAMPRIAMETVEEVAARCGELLAEIVATNEQRLLAHPAIIERLYMNKATRMSTADRIVELAVRNKLELTGIPAYREVSIAIGQELIAEASAEPNPDDILFRETLDEGAALEFDPLAEDTHVVSDEGQEEVAQKFVPLYARIRQMTIAQKIRMAMIGDAAERLLLMRDSNRLVASAAIRSPLIQEPEVVRVSASRVMSEEVLRCIALNKEWVRNYQVKLNLVTNPRTPFPVAARLVPYLREHELKGIAKSKNVTAPIAQAAKQQLDRKAK
ncbi:MAG TPA: hypothetical protein VF881_19450 [Polyangiaceae bacterium]